MNDARYIAFFEDASYNKGRNWELRDQQLSRVIAHYETETEAQRHADALNASGFHWRYGLYFRRGPQACVEIKRATKETAPAELIASIPKNEWASIVCSVSEAGDNGARWQAAREFHGLPERPPTKNSVRYLTVSECEAFGPPGSQDEVTPGDSDGQNVRSVFIYTTHMSGSREAREVKHGLQTYARLVLDAIEARWTPAPSYEGPGTPSYEDAVADIRTLIEMVRERDRLLLRASDKLCQYATDYPEPDALAIINECDRMILDTPPAQEQKR